METAQKLSCFFGTKDWEDNNGHAWMHQIRLNEIHKDQLEVQWKIKSSKLWNRDTDQQIKAR